MNDRDVNIRADWRKLTEKQRNMVSHFLKTGNKLASYRHAYDVEGTKKRTIEQMCYAEFNKPHIKTIINQVREEAVKLASIDVGEIVQDTIDDLIEEQKEVETLKIDAYWVMRKAASLAAFNINKFVKVEEGESRRPYYDFSEATDEDWYCISEITIDEINKGNGDDKYYVDRVRLKTHDKLKALELTARFLPQQENENDPLKQLQRAFKDAFNEDRASIKLD